MARLGLDDGEARKFMNRLHRDNVAQIIILEALRPVRPGMSPNSARNSNHICIANTHLYSNVQRADVKLWQAVNLMRELRQFVFQRDVPLLLCGDFNSEPESAVYEFMMTGTYHFLCICCCSDEMVLYLIVCIGMIQSDRPELLHYFNASDPTYVQILPDLHHLSHDLALTSALHSTLGDEPYFTNYTGKFKGTLDYIFYTHTRIRILAVAPMPEESDLISSSGEGLPSACYPSDHISLCCDVAMVSSGTGSILSSEHTALSRMHGGIPSMMRAHNSSSTNSLASMTGLSSASSASPMLQNVPAMSLLRGHSSTSNLSMISTKTSTLRK